MSNPTHDRVSGGAELLFRPARSVNAFEETVQLLLQSIRLGLIDPGDRLPPERDLATRLAVGRDTLREAIGALADAGYVVVRRGRYGGTFVVDELPRAAPAALGEHARTHDLEDTLVLRRIVEIGAVREAAKRELSGAERDRLWHAVVDCREAAEHDYRRHDSRLHLLIAEFAGAPSLVPIVADVRTRVNELLDDIPLLAPNITHSDEQHEEIVKAILRGNAADAALAMEEHLAGSEALLRGFLA